MFSATAVRNVPLVRYTYATAFSAMRIARWGAFVLSEQITPEYGTGVEQAAYLLTKALPAARVQELRLLWGLVDRTECMAAAVAERAVFHTAEAGAVARTDQHPNMFAVLLHDLPYPVRLDTDLRYDVFVYRRRRHNLMGNW